MTMQDADHGLASENLRRVQSFVNEDETQPLTDERALVLSMDLMRLRSGSDKELGSVSGDLLTRCRALLYQRLRRSENTALGRLIVHHGGMQDACLDVMLCLLLARAGMIKDRPSDGEDILRQLAFNDETNFSIIRALSPGSELFTKGLLFTESFCVVYDPRETLMLHDSIFEAVLGVGPDAVPITAFQSSEEAHEIFSRLFECYRRQFRYTGSVGWAEQRSVLSRLTVQWAARLRASSDLPIAKVLRWSDDGMQIILLCLCREFGMIAADDEMFTGRGIITAIFSASAIVSRISDFIDISRVLLDAAVLQVVGGQSDLSEGTPQERLDWSYEITPEYLDKLGIARRRIGAQCLRTPRIKLNALVLSDAIRDRIDESIMQCQQRRLLFSTWGLSETIPYGTGTTLLLSGPPGVGKTACAEAIAGELGRPLMTVDYSDMLNCFVGNTEKRITAAFRDARESDAVLFFDEADSMFASREDATQRWQIGHTNILLQEIERFEGCCVLSTNRDPCLDHALARRISTHLRFTAPNIAQRQCIWQGLIPDRLPLDEGINWEAVAAVELTGGLIKNALIDAARRAASRGPQSRVTQEDLLGAARDQQWALHREGGVAMGFHIA